VDGVADDCYAKSGQLQHIKKLKAKSQLKWSSRSRLTYSKFFTDAPPRRLAQEFVSSCSTCDQGHLPV